MSKQLLSAEDIEVGERFQLVGEGGTAIWEVYNILPGNICFAKVLKSGKLGSPKNPSNLYSPHPRIVTAGIETGTVSRA